MSAADDGTIDLLTIHEARLITTIGPDQSTSQQLAGQLTWTWQMVTTVMTRLRKIGLVSRDSYPKMTFYRLTGDGLSLLPLIKARTTRTGRFLTGEELAALATEAEAGYDVDTLRARAEATREQAAAAGADTANLDSAIASYDQSRGEQP